MDWQWPSVVIFEAETEIRMVLPGTQAHASALYAYKILAGCRMMSSMGMYFPQAVPARWPHRLGCEGRARGKDDNGYDYVNNSIWHGPFTGPICNLIWDNLQRTT